MSCFQEIIHAGMLLGINAFRAGSSERRRRNPELCPGLQEHPFFRGLSPGAAALRYSLSLETSPVKSRDRNLKRSLHCIISGFPIRPAGIGFAPPSARGSLNGAG